MIYNTINQQLKRKVYESKKARDILDEEFTEFLPIKRNINEFFDVYNTKFYNIELPVHKFFSEQSLKYISDYVNPKEIQKEQLQRQADQIQIDIDSIEQFHPIFKNNTVLTAGGDGTGNQSSYSFYLLQSGKKRKIIGNEMVSKVKNLYRHKDKPVREWTIEVGSSVIRGIAAGPQITEDSDLVIPLYTVNTGKVLPSNIYNG